MPNHYNHSHDTDLIDRKQVKNPATSADGSDSDNGSTLLRKNKSESRVFDSASSSSSSTVTVIGSPSASGFTQINTKAASAKKNTSLLCALCGRKFSDSEKKDRHVVKCAQSKNVDQKTLQKAEDLLERQMAERLSLGLDPGTGNQAKERRPRASNKKTDESDISLAMALSESLQMANEVARRQQEELLLQVANCQPQSLHQTFIACNFYDNNNVKLPNETQFFKIYDLCSFYFEF